MAGRQFGAGHWSKQPHRARTPRLTSLGVHENDVGAGAANEAGFETFERRAAEVFGRIIKTGPFVHYIE